MSLSGIIFTDGVAVDGGVSIGAGSGTPSLTITSSDFTTGYFAGQNVGTSGYTSNSNGDLVCPLYNLSGNTGNIATRISDFYTACGYDPAWSYAFNASWTSYTPASSSILYNGSSYLSAPNSSAFDQSDTSVTVEAWVYPNASGTFYIYGQNTPGFFGLYWSSYNGSFNINQNSFSDPVNGTTSCPAGSWYHVAMCLDANSDTITLYVNGNSEGSQSIGGFASSADTTGIGAQDGVGSYSWFGYITNFRVTKSPNPVYTGNFTPPTTVLQATQSAGTNISAITSGQVQLLLDASSPAAFIKDSSQNNITVTNTYGAVWDPNTPSITAPTVSNYSGLVRAYWSGSNFNMTAIDPANNGWVISGAPNAGSGLTGTFVWPVTLTPYTPATQLDQNNWC